MSFNSLNLPDYILNAIEELSFTDPTPVQECVIPEIFEGHDLMVEARTGTGKTAAYVLPNIKLINDLLVENKDFHILNLILVPTRELALQVTSFYTSCSKFSPQPIKIISVIGGEPIENQISALQEGVQVVVATPGRLLELLELKQIQFQDLQMLILDEADKLFSLEFTEQLELLLKQIPEQRQNLLLSATLPPKVTNFSHLILKDPKRFNITPDEATVENIQQRVIEVNRHKRRALLQHLIKTEHWENAMVFVATKRAAYNLGMKLRKANFSVDAFHGDLDQEDRVKVLNDFKNKKFTVLITTDITARGIDIRKLSAVINYDLPRSPLDYIHRIGRTGRAGEIGKSYTFIDHEDQAHFKIIEKKAGIKLEREQVDGFELTGDAPEIKKGPAPVKGKRKSKKDKLREKQAEQ
jgi:superfamily II DNA/RNA helicase